MFKIFGREGPGCGEVSCPHRKLAEIRSVYSMAYRVSQQKKSDTN